MNFTKSLMNIKISAVNSKGSYIENGINSDMKSEDSSDENKIEKI
jgi:hypothetical protein